MCLLSPMPFILRVPLDPAGAGPQQDHTSERSGSGLSAGDDQEISGCPEKDHASENG